MRVAEILAPLARSGGYLRAREAGSLEYVGPKGLLTDEIRDLIRNHKVEIRTWLRTPAAELPPEDRLAFDYQRTLPDWELDRIFESQRPHRCDDVREMLRAFTGSGIDLRLHGDVVRCRIPRWEGWQRVADELRDRRQEIRDELIRSPGTGRMKEGSFPTTAKTFAEVTI